MEEIRVETFAEFGELVTRFRSGHTTWRGQENASWGLETTLERFFRVEALRGADSYPFDAFFLRLQQVAHFLGNFSGLDLTLHNHLGKTGITVLNFGEAQKYWDDLVLLRHHGFPSFFLDWTQSPWIALYFAFEPAGEADRAVFVMTMDGNSSQNSSSHTPKNPNVSVVTMGFYSKAIRHSRQQCFLMCAYEDQGPAEEHLQPPAERLRAPHEGQIRQIRHIHHIVPIEQAINDAGRESNYKKIVLPASIRREVLTRLAEYNVNHFTLFDNPEAAARTAALNAFVLGYFTQ